MAGEVSTRLRLDSIRAGTGRSGAELTRRDLARALLSVPAATAAAALPELRRDLIAAGNPLSPPFWNAAEHVLGEIAAGRATVGQVDRFVQATGTEPVDLAAEGFVWPPPDGRGPVATEMHAQLVSHLEQLVADGTVDPDRLAADDAQAWADYERLQIDWLRTPLPDGREPMWAVSDEEDDEFLALWDAAEADATAILTDRLAGTPTRPRPDADLAAACRRLRAGLRGGGELHDLLRAAGGVDVDALPDDDVQLWLALGAGVIACRDEPPAGADEDACAAWMALELADWIGAVVTLVRGGVGTPADADSLARYAASFDVEEAAESDDWDDDESADLAALTAGFGTVELLWSLLGAIDDDARLTRLGWWGLPETVVRAWSSDESRAQPLT